MHSTTEQALKTTITKTVHIIAIAVIVSIGIYFLVQLIHKPYVPYTEIVLCDGKEIARVTANTSASVAHPHYDNGWVVWYKDRTRTQLLISHCQSVIIRPVLVTE